MLIGKKSLETFYLDILLSFFIEEPEKVFDESGNFALNKVVLEIDFRTDLHFPPKQLLED